MEQSLEEILREVKEAEDRWERLLKNIPEERKPEVEKPDVLNLGPRPKIIKRVKKTAEPKIPIFPLPNVQKSRGGALNRHKKELRVALHVLSYTEEEKARRFLEERITSLKLLIKEAKKEV